MNTMFPHSVGITPGLNNNMSIGLGLYPDATARLVYDNETATPSPGDTITGGTSGATAYVVGVTVLMGTGARYLFVTDVVGTFVNNEQLDVGLTAIGLADGTTTNYDPNNNPPLVSMYLLEVAPNGVTVGQKGDIGILLSGNGMAVYACDGGTVWRQFTIA